ncbi:hypothetical protein AB0I81_63900 [Nonomuraea sp. NPDC050404]|uniref:hypothetical protein n=1 Tax=Nonomuraea sp. NPDC050404 TaxID=3155783 RepID=UPI0033D1810D
MPGRYRSSDVQYTQRVNAAVELVRSGTPTAQAARMLAERFGVSVRQARRYLADAAMAGHHHVEVPEESVVFTVKLPASLAAQVRIQARQSGVTISALVASALAEALPASVSWPEGGSERK